MIEYREAEGKLDPLPALAAELVALNVDVIVAAAGTLPALAAKQATRTLPIVFIAVGNSVTSGLVTSLARPGSNLTGLSAVSPELQRVARTAQAGRAGCQSHCVPLAARGPRRRG